MFGKRYRLKAGASDNDAAPQEEFNVRTGNWELSQTNEQHILRFLMQWLLVASPDARRYALELYGPLLTPSLCVTRFYIFPSAATNVAQILSGTGEKHV
jgi:hypothetical protein